MAASFERPGRAYLKSGGGNEDEMDRRRSDSRDRSRRRLRSRSLHSDGGNEDEMDRRRSDSRDRSRRRLRSRSRDRDHRCRSSSRDRRGGYGRRDNHRRDNRRRDDRRRKNRRRRDDHHDDRYYRDDQQEDRRDDRREDRRDDHNCDRDRDGDKDRDKDGKHDSMASTQPAGAAEEARGPPGKTLSLLRKMIKSKVYICSEERGEAYVTSEFRIISDMSTPGTSTEVFAVCDSKGAADAACAERVRNEDAFGDEIESEYLEGRPPYDNTDDEFQYVDDDLELRWGGAMFDEVHDKPTVRISVEAKEVTSISDYPLLNGGGGGGGGSAIDK